MSEAGWWTRAFVGQKVVCVRAQWLPPVYKVDPKVGEVLTIKEIEFNSFYDCGVGLDFGFSSPEGHILRYGAQWFRPVQTNSTEVGMAVFKEILERETISVSEPVKADA